VRSGTFWVRFPNDLERSIAILRTATDQLEVRFARSHVVCAAGPVFDEIAGKKNEHQINSYEIPKRTGR
jgi:hypothetical protein